MSLKLTIHHFLVLSRKIDRGRWASIENSEFEYNRFTSLDARLPPRLGH